jgi:hypothetical protein
MLEEFRSSSSFEGLSLLACSGSEFIRQLLGLLRQWISPAQGLYLHRTTQHRKTPTHPCLEWDSDPRSQCSCGRRQYVLQTARQRRIFLLYLSKDLTKEILILLYYTKALLREFVALSWQNCSSVRVLFFWPSRDDVVAKLVDCQLLPQLFN